MINMVHLDNATRMETRDLLPRVRDLYNGKTLLITGGTGFMGKVLIEKLLRCCPDVDTVYVLIRPKKGKAPEERWAEVAKQEVFDRVRQEQPDNLDKIKIVVGDNQIKGLGLSVEDRRIITERVQYIFNVAATVLFMENIADSLTINVRGTLEMVKLAQECKNLEGFLHVSTCFANVDKPYAVEEKTYPAVQNWRHLISLLDTTDPYVFGCLTNKILAGHPNSYTLTKSLGEDIVKYYSQFFPVAIVRPAIVMNSLKEPIPGWVDNLNGPSTIGLLAGSGMLRVQLLKKDAYSSYISVDTAINACIAAVWDLGVSKGKDESSLKVYNSTFHERLKFTNQNFKDLGLKCAAENPMEEQMWHPDVIMTECPFLYSLLFLLIQVLLAALFDTVLRLKGAKPKLWKITKKIAVAQQIYLFFTTRTFKFSNKELYRLRDKMHDIDKETFYVDAPENLNTEDILKLCAVGFQKYVLKQKKSLEERLQNYRKFKLMDIAVKLGFFVLIGWLLVPKVLKYFQTFL